MGINSYLIGLTCIVESPLVFFLLPVHLAMVLFVNSLSSSIKAPFS